MTDTSNPTPDRNARGLITNLSKLFFGADGRDDLAFFIECWSNGNPKIVGRKNKQRQFEGPYKMFYENGQMSVDATMDAQSVFVGGYKEFYRNGALKVDGTYNAQGELSGICREYNKNGTPEHLVVYDNGKDVYGFFPENLGPDLLAQLTACEIK